LAAEALKLGDALLKDISGRELARRKGIFAAFLILLAPAGQDALREVIFTAELGRAFRSRGELAHDLKFELTAKCPSSHGSSPLSAVVYRPVSKKLLLALVW
jgi:hypothetical protein